VKGGGVGERWKNSHAERGGVAGRGGRRKEGEE